MKTTSEINLSVIIVNYNTADELRACIQSVKKQTAGISYEIIVVDNNSHDHSKSMLKNEFATVECHFLQFNSGFSYANNYAMERSESEFILLLNPDTFLIENSLKVMVDFMRSNPAVGAIGPVVEDPNGNLQLSMSRFPDLKLQLLDALYLQGALKRYALTEDQRGSIASKIPFEVDWVSGGCIMLRKAIYNEIGGLDEQFHLFSEDVDWCLRIKEGGWNIYCLPNTKVIHIGGASISKNYFTLVSNRFRSRLIYARKHFNKLEFFAVRIITLLGLSLRLTGALFKKFSGTKEKKERIAAYFHALLLWTGIKKLHPVEREKN